MSLIKVYILSFFLLMSFINFGQTAPDICIIYKPRSIGTCYTGAYRDGRDNKKVEFSYKYSKGFEICYEVFTIKPNACVIELTSDEIKTLNIIDIDSFKRIHEEKIKIKSSITNPNILFPKIFILQMMNDNKYQKIEVNWEEFEYSNSGGGG